MAKAKERVIYDNTNLWTDANVEAAKENIMDRDEELTEDDITEDDIWEELDFQDEIDWEYEKANLESGLNNPYGYLVCGTLELWDGLYDGGRYYNNFDDMINGCDGLFKDCDYIKIYDVDGHLYMQGTHHDGTNEYEVKELTEKGYELLDKSSWMDRRKLHEKMWHCNLFTRLPHFAHKVYGVPKTETVSQSA